MMKISVIIPTYHPGNYLFECLKSIEHQTLSKSEYEVIIVLNGDKEPYYTIIKNRIREFKSNIKVITIKEKGVSVARNIGLENAEGKYIAFIDDDDKVSDNYLENLLKCLGNRQSCISVSNVLTFNAEGKIRKDYISKAFDDCKTDESTNLFHMRKFCSTVWCKLIPRVVIGDTKFNQHFTNGEDSLFMASISSKIGSVILSPKDTIYFRRLRIGSASRSKINFFKKLQNKLFLICNYFKIYISNIKENNVLFVISRIVAQFIRW